MGGGGGGGGTSYRGSLFPAPIPLCVSFCAWTIHRLPAQSKDPYFVEDNPWIVQIHTLSLTYTVYIYLFHISLLTVHFPMTRSVRYQPILHTLYYTLHTEHAYCLSYRFLNNVVITTMVEMVEILDGSLGKCSVERVRYIYYTWSL